VLARHPHLTAIVAHLGAPDYEAFLGDFPNIPYAYAEQIAGLVRLDLGEPWLRAVCWRNAASLFGLAAGS